MGTKKSDGKRSLTEMEDEGEEEDEETVLGFLGDDEEEKKKRNFSKKGKRGGGGAAAEAACQVDDCTADMSGAKTYYRRHKVCELHARAAVAPVAGLRQRFCQQCSRFHDVSEFDDNKRSCRHRLAGHNERRRKSSSNEHCHGEGSSYLS